jgi:hypothetical protein
MFESPQRIAVAAGASFVKRDVSFSSEGDTEALDFSRDMISFLQANCLFYEAFSGALRSTGCVFCGLTRKIWSHLECERADERQHRLEKESIMESSVDAAKASMENARTAMEKLDRYIESLVEMQQSEPGNWEHAETLMTLAQTLTDLANDANPV